MMGHRVEEVAITVECKFEIRGSRAVKKWEQLLMVDSSGCYCWVCSRMWIEWAGKSELYFEANTR